MIRLTRKLDRGVSLLVLSFFLQTGCHNDPSPVGLVWEGDRAVAISIPKKLLGGESDAGTIEVQLVQTEERGPVLGEIKVDGPNIVFTPLVPLTRGRDYEVVLNGKAIGTVAVPRSDAKAPELIAIYPTQDSVPENLLKLYFKFSSPMVEGNSLANITLLRNERDTVKGTFLDLSPELWNSDGTMLTLWLDPGRIKRDLIPNKQLGKPLEPSTSYSLYVSGKWRSKDGVEMGAEYVKNFTTLQRDGNVPVPDRWNLGIPGSGTSNPLTVDLLESLDYSLLNDAISLMDENQNVIKGEWVIGKEERSVMFVPDNSWTPGVYVLHVETRLEDLAGNNINRPFDRDVKKTKEFGQKEYVERHFLIR
ncbi:MAG TPA: hypothetical protein VG737_17965 [Cyclobacteriaceae bacterium]|nr:hypothetical protein [Cyclobacteriaceae bacterium]